MSKSYGDETTTISVIFNMDILVIKDSTQYFPNSTFSHNARPNMNVGKKDESKHGILFSKSSELNVKVP